MAQVVIVQRPVWTYSVGPWKTGIPEVDLFGVGVGWYLTSPGTVSASLDDTDSITLSFTSADAAIPITERVTDLYIRRNGQFLFRGRCMSSNDAGSESRGESSFTFSDYVGGVLSHRKLQGNKEYNLQYEHSIVRDLLSYIQGETAGNLGITMGDWGKPDVDRTITFERGTSFADCLAQLQSLSNGPTGFYVDENLRLNLYQSVDKGVILDYGGLVQSYSRGVDSADFGNAGWQQGAEKTKPATGEGVPLELVPRVASDLGTTPEGRWDIFWTDTELLTPQAIEAAANKSFADSATTIPSWVFTISEGAWRGPSHVWTGDIVTYRIKHGRHNVSAKARVIDISITLDLNGTETVTITVDKRPASQRRAIKKLAKKTSTIFKGRLPY